MLKSLRSPHAYVMGPNNNIGISCKSHLSGSLWRFVTERAMHPFICNLCVPFRSFTGLSRYPLQLNILVSLPCTEIIATMEDVCITCLDIYS